jgi:hypothetical protein
MFKLFVDSASMASAKPAAKAKQPAAASRVGVRRGVPSDATGGTRWNNRSPAPITFPFAKEYTILQALHLRSG